ncbi:hypothetical protein PSHT_08435 [Puccinia striiformis]|uniref:Major facilitator superfamily (MFS) profile domain-containing protein n=1 Tax=Puccinia striiformis TaxID=27350 RepID=A0A2S4VPV0_9BASI|nr:hypothetical protein PSHT_08435 [Puccinia striiformis]
MQDTAVDSKTSVSEKDAAGVMVVPPASLPPLDPESARLAEVSAKLDNPLGGFTIEELSQQAEEFCQAHGLEEHAEVFKRGAILAADQQNLDRVPNLTEDERRFIEYETTHRWKQPLLMYYIAVLSSMAAIVQGMDEAVVNGAQIFYYDRFGIQSDGTNKTALIQGLVNSAPYLCCALFACWITDPCNRWLGRRGVIFWSCFIAGVASIWEAFTYSWPQLFVARLFLGLGIGPKSATAPIYTAECAPAPIRGALVMQWQMWTAFGIALGDVVSVIFVDVEPDLAWRLMLGSTVVAPIFVCAMIYFAPESPRWYMSKGRVADAFASMRKLRFCDLQASRDLFYIAKLLEIENKTLEGRNLLTDMWKVPRVRRAAQASGLVMFMQQFCGVNVIAYYSSQVFIEAGFGRKDALLTTMGTGIVNWVFAIPAFYTIDTFGRRNLLLATFPAMAVCLLITGLAFYIPVDGPDDHRRVGVVAAAIYIYMAFYSPGEGPVPFTYSAEAFPLYIRDFGMSYATAVCWFFKLVLFASVCMSSGANKNQLFSFVLAITFPMMLTAFKPQGAFGWYAGWCIIGWVAVFFILPETKALTLEELDYVFSVPTRRHASYQWKNFFYCFNKYVLRKNVAPLPPLWGPSSYLQFISVSGTISSTRLSNGFSVARRVQAAYYQHFPRSKGDRINPPSSVVGWTPLIAINSQLDLSAYNSVKTKYTMSSDSNEKNTTYTKEQSNPVLPPEVEEIARMSSKLANPLAGLTTLELIDEAEEFCLKYSLMEHVHSFRRGAILAADPSDLDRLPEITDDERQWVSFESTRQWKQPMTMLAFGIALGDIVSVVFVDISPDLAWRLMLGSTAVAPMLVCMMIFPAPESPRWYMSRGRIADAYKSMCRLRFCELQASRDIFYMAKLLEAEQETTAGRSLFKDLWRVPRVRRAAQSSALVMFMQQFCGVNVIAYYSSQIFIDAGFGRKQALLTTMGTGLVNWVFAIPAMYTIDTFGRRNLLLVTLPCMAICLLVTGMAFFIPQEGGNDHRRAFEQKRLTALEFMQPVPFTYSAEAFPLYIRDFGMSFATAVCWFFKRKELSAGMVSKLRPETKALTLEELDAVFSVSTSKHASYQVKNLIFHLRKYILRQRVEPLPCLYETGKLFPSS